MIVLGFDAETSIKRNRSYWIIRCDCGKTFTKLWTSIRDGKRCGRCKPITHGFRPRKNGLPEYRIWSNILDRCYRKKHKNFPHYGGRGIDVCERWRASFQNFYDDMGARPSPKHSVDRRDNDKGYTPENCHWATHTQQCRNKRTTFWVNYKGKKLSLRDACDISGMPVGLVHQRIRVLGWSHDDAFSIPVNGRGRNGRRVATTNS
jgi:hypothetical protein